ncbi:MAG: helix-turn-helix domain-containing protein [Clostridia bacterium]|nr:helix-turn-helix domain-containing protein [Clostridia bacterium]
MKTAIYGSSGIKIAGDESLSEKLPAHILLSELPIMENGCLYSKLTDGNISLICADEKALEGFLEKKEQSKRITKNEFVKNLLFGTVGTDVKSLCGKYGFLFDEVRRVFVAELNEDISSYVSVLEEVLAENNITVVALDSFRIAVICLECECEPEEMANAISATFAELNIDYNMGVSCICDNASQLSEAFEQALSAIRVGKKLSYSGGVWFFSNILPELIISSLPQDAVACLKEKAEQVRRSLDAETIELAEEFFKHNLNISETARYSYLHRNTLIYRLDRIQKETGFNLRNFDEAVALRIYIAANKVFR